MQLQPLVGDVKSQFECPLDGVDESVEAARLEQEAMCGYPLVVKSVRAVDVMNTQNQRVYDVYATFAPAPAG